MKPYIFFKNKLKLVDNRILVVWVMLGSAIALIATPGIGQTSRQQNASARSEILCWHIGMGSADICDPFFDTTDLKFTDISN